MDYDNDDFYEGQQIYDGEDMREYGDGGEDWDGEDNGEFNENFDDVNFESVEDKDIPKMMEKETTYQAEFAAFERIGLTNVTTSYLDTAMTTAGQEFGAETKSEKLLLQDPKVKFIIRLDKIYRTLSEEHDLSEKLKPSEGDLKNMLENMENVNDFGAKNAFVYYLGYFSTHGGKKDPSQKKIKQILEDRLPTLDGIDGFETKTVKPVDIIRYSRLWLKTF